VKKIVQTNILNEKMTSFVLVVLYIALTVALSLSVVMDVSALRSNTPIADFPQVDVNGRVNAIETNPDGSVYVAGDFTAIGGISRTNIARILSDGTVDPDFAPNPNSAEYDEETEEWSDSSYVTALSYDAVSNQLYIAGNFMSIGEDIVRTNLAAVDGSTGEVGAFNATVSGAVYTIETTNDGDGLYVGGAFTVVNGDVLRNELALFDTATSEARAFNASVSSTECSFGDDTVYALQHDEANNQLYVAGRVYSFGGTARRGLARLNATTGALDTSFNPDIRQSDAASQCPIVRSLVVNDDVVYAGGYFDRVNATEARQNLAAFSRASGDVLSLNVAVDSDVHALAHNSAGNTLFVGGGFTTVDGVTRNELAEVDIDTDEVTDFNPDITAEFPETVYALGLDAEGTLYAGGRFSMVGDEPRYSLAAFLDPDQDDDGISGSIENDAPNNGDGNNDGVGDAQQSHVTSLPNTETGTYVTVVAPSGTAITTVTTESAPAEAGLTHLFGLTGFTVTGVTPGDTIPIEIFYPNPDRIDEASVIAKKYFPATTSYQDLDGATVTSLSIDTQPTLRLNYVLTDGGKYDLDGIVDGSITDPVSLATSVTDTLADTGQNQTHLIAVTTLLIIFGAQITRKAYK